MKIFGDPKKSITCELNFKKTQSNDYKESAIEGCQKNSYEDK